MAVFEHLLYEYTKGIRGLVLHTFSIEEKEQIENKLTARGIDHLFQKITDKKMNVFFGNPECVEVVRLFGDKRLNEYSSEEDFILGIMLGYSREDQCKRYLKTKHRAAKRCRFIEQQHAPSERRIVASYV